MWTVRFYLLLWIFIINFAAQMSPRAQCMDSLMV